jgi:hypothetical protein
MRQRLFDINFFYVVMVSFDILRMGIIQKGVSHYVLK